MRKIIFISLALMEICLSVRAQSELNIYQDERIIKTLPVSQVDSITVTESDPRNICLWHNGDVFLTYSEVEVDSITLPRDGGEPLSYIGIIGFNDELFVKDIDILSSHTASSYKSFVNSLPAKDGTLLYYAVDNALDMLNGKEFMTPMNSVNIITFMDGLDQGSIMKKTNHSSSSAYLSAISQTIRNDKVHGLPLSAYTIGLKGNDVNNVSLFRENLYKLASSDDKAFEISSINDLQSKFKDIADEIIRSNTRQTINVTFPCPENGTRLRFVFDGEWASLSELYIEGTFNLDDCTLRDVTYHGMTAHSGSVVHCYLIDHIYLDYVSFTLRGLQSESGVLPRRTSCFSYLPYKGWELKTSGFDSRRSVMHKGISIMLVLDCSSSLGSDFSRMQNYTNSFIDIMADNASPCDIIGTPQNVKAELAIKNSDLVVSLNWDMVPYAASYDVYHKGGNSYNSDYALVASDVTTTCWLDEKPLSGDNYYYIVAKGHNMTSSKSAYAYINYMLDAPTDVKADFTESGDAVIVTWSAPIYAQSYDVYRSSTRFGTYTLVASDVTSTSWTDNSPLSRTNYYQVCAAGYGLESAMSNAVMPIKPFSGLVINVNGIAINMVKVDGGTFQMGATPDQGNEPYYGDEYDDELGNPHGMPAHSVTVSDFWIGETEVTQALWEAVMGSNPSHFKGSNRPVEMVLKGDCVKFVNKLNSLLSGQLPAGRKFRLPSEVEWEFAARGGSMATRQTKYAGSNNIEDVAWYEGNSSSSTHDVKTMSPNALGIYDMSGNVSEWCYYYHYYNDGSSTIEYSNSIPLRPFPLIFRGGSYSSSNYGCRVSERCVIEIVTSSYPNSYVGFRLAL